MPKLFYIFTFLKIGKISAEIFLITQQCFSVEMKKRKLKLKLCQINKFELKY